MTDRQLPHDPYITAVVDALTKADLEPTEWWTSSAEIDPYRDDDNAGIATMLDAVLLWDDEHPALNRDAHQDGIGLVWDHPAEQWQWAARKANGHFERDPEFLALSRWASPHDVVSVVRELLDGRPAPMDLTGRWHRRAEMQAAVDAWAADES